MRGWCFQRLFQSFVFGGVLGIFGVPQPLKQCKLSIQFYGNQPYIKLFPLWTSVLAGSTRCMYIHSSPATCCATPRLTVERSPLAYSLASICFFSTCWDSAFPKLTERSMRISPEADLFVTSVQKKKEPFWRRSLGGFGFSLLFFPISMRFVFFLADFLKICGYFRIFTISLEGNLFEGTSVYLYFWGASDSGILQEKCKVGITNTNAATCPTEK